uniref:Uncharacterized protein n=1 Tax=Lutzomyia longipalpis TaxID=7200 RepID=A0A1B0GI67_LUTLO
MAKFVLSQPWLPSPSPILIPNMDTEAMVDMDLVASVTAMGTTLASDMDTMVTLEDSTRDTVDTDTDHTNHTTHTAHTDHTVLMALHMASIVDTVDTIATVMEDTTGLSQPWLPSPSPILVPNMDMEATVDMDLVASVTAMGTTLASDMDTMVTLEDSIRDTVDTDTDHTNHTTHTAHTDHTVLMALHMASIVDTVDTIVTVMVDTTG